MSWLLSVWGNAICDVIKGTLVLFDETITIVFTLLYGINKAIPLDETMEFIKSLALGLISVLVFKQAIEIYVFNVEGDPDADPLEMISRVIQTVATIVCGDYVVNLMIIYTHSITDKMLSTLVTSDSYSKSLDAVLKATDKSFPGAAGFVLTCIIAVMHFSFLFLFFRAAKRGGELILFQAVLPLMGLNLLTTSREKFNSFKNELGICVFGYMAQLFCLRVFLYLLALFAERPLSGFMYLLAAVAWIIMTISAPKWLQKISNSTGIRVPSFGGVSTAAMYIMPQLIRK